MRNCKKSGADSRQLPDTSCLGMSPWRLRRAARVLHCGGLVAHPTEGVWGLACDPANPGAIMRLLAAKQRDPGKGLILIGHNRDAIAPWLDPAAGTQMARAAADWPGPVTWLLPPHPRAPWWLTGQHDSIAVRVSAHPVAAALSRAFGGALVSTSANIAGHPAALSSWQVRAQLRDWVDLIIAGTLQNPGVPSTIRHGEDGRRLR